jgi:peptide/nickel transport system substrate-binding protein
MKGGCKMKFFKLVLIGLMAVGLVFTASSSFAKVTLVYGTTEKVTDMDPANAYDFHTWEIFENIYRGLLAYPPGKTNLVPGLAESYDVVDGGKGYIFKLKKGVKFSDGTPFDANAVKWSIDRVIRIQGDPSWLVTDFVESVEVLDKYRVKFNLKNQRLSGRQDCSGSLRPKRRETGGPGSISGGFLQTRPANCPGGQSLLCR